MSNITSAVELITPDQATEMLGRMPTNRTMRPRAVERYAADILADRWAMNGEPIIIDEAGNVIDGQHRLKAVVLANKPVHFLVVRGVPTAHIESIDTGVGRNYKDVLTLRGHDLQNYGFTLAGAARLWVKYESDEMSHNRAISYAEVDEVIAKHPQLVESVKKVSALTTIRRACYPAAQSFLHAWLSERVDPEIADLFLGTLDTGAGLMTNDPIYLLRRRLVERTGPLRMRTEEVLALSIKAYNAWAENQELSVLGFRPSSEAFPVIGKTTASQRYQRKRSRQKREARVAAGGEPNVIPISEDTHDV